MTKFLKAFVVTAVLVLIYSFVPQPFNQIIAYALGFCLIYAAVN